MRLDIKESLLFPFSDPNWALNIFLGTICYLTFPLGLVLWGYKLTVIEQTALGQDDRMPRVTEVVKLWLNGLRACASLLLLFALPTFATFATLAAFSEFTLGPADQAWTAVGIASGVGLLFFVLCLSGLLFLSPAMLLRYAMTGQSDSFFDLSGRIREIRYGFKDYFAIVAFTALAYLALVVLAVATLGFGLLFTFPGFVFLSIVQAHMLGNYYRIYFA